MIANPDSLVSFKGIVLDLNEVGIEGGSETDYAINPTLSGEYLALESASGAAVAITNAMDAVNSENNLRFGGEGKLVSISTAEYDAKSGRHPLLWHERCDDRRLGRWTAATTPRPMMARAPPSDDGWSAGGGRASRV